MALLLQQPQPQRRRNEDSVATARSARWTVDATRSSATTKGNSTALQTQKRRQLMRRLELVLQEGPAGHWPQQPPRKWLAAAAMKRSLWWMPLPLPSRLENRAPRLSERCGGGEAPRLQQPQSQRANRPQSTRWQCLSLPRSSSRPLQPSTTRPRSRRWTRRRRWRGRGRRRWCRGHHGPRRRHDGPEQRRWLGWRRPRRARGALALAQAPHAQDLGPAAVSVLVGVQFGPTAVIDFRCCFRPLWLLQVDHCVWAGARRWRWRWRWAVWAGVSERWRLLLELGAASARGTSIGRDDHAWWRQQRRRRPRLMQTRLRQASQQQR